MAPYFINTLIEPVMHKIIAADYQNPDATSGLKLDMVLVVNTSDEEINGNIKRNSEIYKNWLQYKEPHDRPAILIGGGSSINDHIKDIKNLQREGATVFAMNAASKWAYTHGIKVDYQVILDAREETFTLVDHLAKGHLFASQCHPKTLSIASNLTLWHPDREDVEDHLPPERVKAGGYVIVGGGATVGIIGLCLAYTQGYKYLHVFGYDGSYKNGKGHAYKQPMNDGEPTMRRSWAGKDFIVPMGIYEQPAQFIKFTTLLKSMGCKFTLYGEGIVQTMYNTPASQLCESEKYELLWLYDRYREYSPGENIVDMYLDRFKPKGKIIDFGCGTGRAGIKFDKAGLDVLLIDFTPNSRDDAALSLPFMKIDLTLKLSVTSEYGFCTDVMEHIPREYVSVVIDNIMNASEEVFFQISTVDDIGGSLIGATLHNTVESHSWWEQLFIGLGYNINYESDLESVSLFNIQHIGENNAS